MVNPIRFLALPAALCLLAGPFRAQTVPPGAAHQAAAVPAPVERRDPLVDEAAQVIGKPLLLRCLCTGEHLRFDSGGRLQGEVKRTDWTLAALNVQKVERKGADEVELQGVRVAMRYNPDRREWERHSMKDEAVRVTLSGVTDASAAHRVLGLIFASGIERSLQFALPPLWLHFFAPGAAWPPDALGSATIYNAADPARPAGLVAASVLHKAGSDYTPEGRRDRVQGTVALRMVIDATGVPQRISVAQPLGYGLDEKAAEAAAKYRFQPATLEGKPVASQITFREEFSLATPPR